MLDLPAELTGLDLIYLSWCATCWLPDLDLLAATVAGRLRHHGSVLICHHHPLREVLTVRGENLLSVTSDYFGRGRPRALLTTPSGRPAPAARTERRRSPAFVWPVSDVGSRAGHHLHGHPCRVALRPAGRKDTHALAGRSRSV
jgi:hypothetical protein